MTKNSRLFLLAGGAALTMVMFSAEFVQPTQAAGLESPAVQAAGRGEVDAAGPFKLALPADLCTNQISRTEGLPPDNPIALDAADTPEKRAVISAYYEREAQRSLQTQYCAPVIPVEMSATSKAALPAACTTPPDPTALFNPLHPMADMSRPDVKEAFDAYVKASAAYEALRAQCMELAGHPLPKVEASMMPPPPPSAAAAR